MKRPELALMLSCVVGTHAWADARLDCHQRVDRDRQLKGCTQYIKGAVVANKKFVVELGPDERARLNELISRGKASAKAILKARILLKADQGEGGEGWPDATTRFKWCGPLVAHDRRPGSAAIPSG